MALGLDDVLSKNRVTIQDPKVQPLVNFESETPDSSNCEPLTVIAMTESSLVSKKSLMPWQAAEKATVGEETTAMGRAKIAIKKAQSILEQNDTMISDIHKRRSQIDASQLKKEMASLSTQVAIAPYIHYYKGTSWLDRIKFILFQ